MGNNSLFCLNNNLVVVMMVRLFFLLIIFIMSLPCQSTATTTMHNNSNKDYRTARTLQEEDDYDPCSLCQGVPISFDKRVPSSDGSDYQPTCNEVDLYFRYNFTTDTEEDYIDTIQNQAGADETINPYQSGISASCKSNYGYNFYFDLCCQPSIPKYECEQNIQQRVIDNGVYNTIVPPIISNNNGPLEVSVFLQFEALEHIEVEDGTATIFVSITLKWKDERLKWTVDDYDTCSNIINVWTGHDIETTSIWVPNFELLNRIEGVQEIEASKATVYSDGSVIWSMTGGLKAFCAFTGLANIPFDTMGCQMLFGSGSGRQTSIVYRLEFPDNVFFGAFDVTYNEWRPVPEMAKYGYTFNSGVIYYNVYFKRSTRHYISNIVVPTIILTYLSFFTFLLDLRIGERLGFGMALALVVVAQQIVTSGLTPISNQRLWLDKFVGWSFYWVLFGVIQSVCIGFLYYIREDRMARKQHKRLTLMSPAARVSMMDKARAAAEEDAAADSAADRGSEEEKMMLTDSTLVEEIDVDVERRRGGCGDFFYTFSLRKMDIASLTFAVVTYTIFITVMLYLVRSTDVWLADEPKWFDESDQSYLQNNYDNYDPNSR